MIQIRTNVDMELPNVINVTCFYFREKHFYMTISLNSVLIRLDQFLQISSACTRPVPARNFWSKQIRPTKKVLIFVYSFKNGFLSFSILVAVLFSLCAFEALHSRTSIWW